MNAADFRRLALSLEGAIEGSHMGAADFRVGGRIFATLASEKQGYGNLMLTPEVQAEFVENQPDVFLPVAGGWGRMGGTHIRLAGRMRIYSPALCGPHGNCESTRTRNPAQKSALSASAEVGPRYSRKARQSAEKPDSDCPARNAKGPPAGNAYSA